MILIKIITLRVMFFFKYITLKRIVFFKSFPN